MTVFIFRRLGISCNEVTSFKFNKKFHKFIDFLFINDKLDEFDISSMLEDIIYIYIYIYIYGILDIQVRLVFGRLFHIL